MKGVPEFASVRGSGLVLLLVGIPVALIAAVWVFASVAGDISDLWGAAGWWAIPVVLAAPTVIALSTVRWSRFSRRGRRAP